ncbi:MAG: hypothetical protein E6J43_12800 [Chloroflexi bacterium]|nr:MAG: hypothetical protein E6J43_12800 [Chloroflexota bacterium]
MRPVILYTEPARRVPKSSDAPGWQAPGVPPAPARHNAAPDPPGGLAAITAIMKLTGSFGQRCTSLRLQWPPQPQLPALQQGDHVWGDLAMYMQDAAAKTAGTIKPRCLITPPYMSSTRQSPTANVKKNNAGASQNLR